MSTSIQPVSHAYHVPTAALNAEIEPWTQYSRFSSLETFQEEETHQCTKECDRVTTWPRRPVEVVFKLRL